MTEYKIWDPLVRIFHWSLATGFVANAVLIDKDSTLHEQVGLAMVALVLIRLIWGLIGPRAARFASFWPTGTAILAQLSDIATRRERAHLSHTPLGALMILNLLATMLAIGLTGYMMTITAFWGVEWVEKAHEALVSWVWLSIVLHVAAVLWESWRTGTNLPRAMITGRKRASGGVRLEE